MTDRDVNKRLFGQIEQVNEQSINDLKIFKGNQQVTWLFSFKKLCDQLHFKTKCYVTKSKIQS